MERFIYKLVKVQDIKPEEPFSLRYQLRDAALEHSIEKRGILTPVLVTSSGDRLQLIAGHKRMAAARRLEFSSIPVCELQGSPSLEDLWMVSILSNWNQGWHDLDRCWALKKGRLDWPR